MKTIRFVALEVTCILILSIIILMMSRIDVDFSFVKFSDQSVYFYMIVHVIIAAFIYVVFRSFVGRKSTVVTVVVASAILSYVSSVKYGHLKEPLVFNDIYNLSQASVIIKYAGFFEWALLSSLVVAVVVLLLRRRVWTTVPRALSRLGILFVSLLVFSYGYVSAFKESQKVFIDHGMEYFSWNLVENYKRNGMYLHLMQTSMRSIPSPPSPQERSSFLDRPSPKPIDGPEKVIFVLCESCWYDEDNFKMDFSPLNDRATAIFRGVSPVFGGRTPNATFEWLVGLPANDPAVTGVIYQEYKELISPKPWTLPNLYRDLGYVTISAHNFFGYMWSRNKVKPRLGFDKFLDINDLNITQDEYYFPRDSYLFDAAKIYLNTHKNDKLFLHLTTVHMHGPYQPNGDDFGVQSYLDKVGRTIADVADFIDSMREQYPSAVIVVYSDHKPGLWSFFSQRDDGRPDGDVPVWVLDQNRARARAFAQTADGRGFFCASHAFSEFYIGITLPQSASVRERCAAPLGGDHSSVDSGIPSWVYHMALFD